MPTAQKVRRASRSSEVPFERRTFRSDDATMTDDRHFVGHAAVYEQRTAIGNPLSWGFYEEVARGAFDKTVSDGADVVFDWDHDTRWVLARTSNGTLKLDPADKAGLGVDADMAPVSYANDLRVLVERGDVRGMSFQFQTVKDEWRTEQVETSDGQTVDVEVRTLLECRLIDVTATALPAYAGTDTDLRHSITAARESRAIRSGAVLEEVELREVLATAADLLRSDNTDAALRTIDAALSGTRTSQEPAVTTPDGTSDGTEPAQTTRTEVAAQARARRMRALAALHGLGTPAQPPTSESGNDSE
jgi:hypothetical protein